MTRSPAVVRATWIATALLVSTLLALSIRPAVDRLQRVCDGPNCASADMSASKLADLAALGLSPAAYATYLVGLSVTMALVFVGISALLIWRRPEQRIAVLGAFTLLIFGPITFSGFTPILADVYPAVRVPLALLQYAGGALFILFIFIFPDGRFVPGWTRWITIVFIVVQWPATLFPGMTPEGRALFLALRLPFFVVGLSAAVYAQAYRYHHVSSVVQRQQTKWTALGFTAGLGGYLVVNLLVTPFVLTMQQPSVAMVIGLSTVQNLLMSLIPLSIGVAVLRHRLWNVDRLINRTLVYAALTASIVAVYVLTVGYLSLLLRADDNLVISLIGTGAAAALFQPLRDRLQRAVNRLVYGQRDEPYTVLSQLGERLEATLAPGAAPPAIAETVVQALRLPYAAVRVAREGALELVAEAGEPIAPRLVLPLVHQGELVGELLVGALEDIGAAERRLLDDIARRAGAAVHAARLADELQRSRERLVTAREEERRRLRRELHDGLGPTLAALTLKLETARNRLGDDPAAAEILSDLAGRAQAAVADVRRVAYDLRPPALDELGLVDALHQAANSFETRADDALQIEVDAQPPPPLSAAVEVAAHRIAQEALTNVVRHAGARRAHVRLTTEDDALVVEIADDGRGLPPVRRHGVGLTSMRERAEELGGSCDIVAGDDGGTRVVARLPLLHESATEVRTA